MFEVVNYQARRPVSRGELVGALAELSAEAGRAEGDIVTKARLARTAMDMVADVSSHQQLLGRGKPTALARLQFLGDVLTAACAEVVEEFRS